MIAKALLLYFSSAAVALTGAVMPGPMFTAVVGESLRRGPSAGPLFVLGHALLELALFACVVAGLGPFLSLPVVGIAVGSAGGLIMTLMAVSMLRSLKTVRLDLTGGKAGGRLALQGAILSLSNPYWIVWWATIGLGWIGWGLEAGPAGLAAVFLGHVSGDLLWYAALSVAVSKGRRFLNDLRYRIVIGICAGALGAFGALFVVRAFLQAAKLA